MKATTLSAARELKSLMGHESGWVVAMYKMLDNEVDFYSTDDKWRIIRQGMALEILTKELASEEYLLGCFNDWFLADITGLPAEVFSIIQKAGAFEAAGKIVAAMGKIEELAREYVRLDGYGHHFGQYDGDQYEIEIDGVNYLVFRVN